MDIGQFTASLRGRSAAPARPSSLESIYSTGHWLLARGRPRDAARVFRVLLRLAPRDERGWLGLGECHERVGQPRVAAELFGAGSVIAGGEQAVSVRCLLARSRALRVLGRTCDSDAALDAAERAAGDHGDESLVSLVASERRRAS